MVVPNDSPIRPLFEVFRRETPGRKQAYKSQRLRGELQPKIDDDNPAKIDGKIKGRDGEPYVSVDHIVPLAEVMQLPRFTELTLDNKWLVVNALPNLQWLDTDVNRAKGSKSVTVMKNISPEWQREQDQLQGELRVELIEIIAQLADSQI